MKLFKTKKFLIIGILIAAVIGGGIFFFSSKQASAQNTAKKQKEYTLRKKTLQKTLSISGDIDATEKVTLRFQSSGMLTWVGVKTGDRVQKYQAIASLDTRELKKRLEKYLLSYSKTRWDFETSKDSYRQPPYWGLTQIQRQSADRTFEKAQFDLNSSVLDVELQDIALQYATLTTPIGGIVTNIDSPNPGVNITPAQAGFDIVNPNTLYLSVLADQTEVTSITPGMKATLTLDPYPDETVTGTVSSIAYTPKAGESGTVYEVKITIPKSKFYDTLRLGMTGDAVFITKEIKNILAVPSEYVKADGDTKYVMKQTPSGIKRQNVTVGEESDTETQITSGLREGDVIYD